MRRDIPPPVDHSTQVYDVFISHASEDKDEVVRPLATALQQEVIAFSPSLADRLARNTALHTTDEIAAEIAEPIEGNGS